MSKYVVVQPNHGSPEYPSIEKGKGEVVVHFVGENPRTNSFLGIFCDALALAKDEHDRHRPGVMFARLMIDEEVLERGNTSVVLPHQGAVALRGALVEHAATYGDSMDNGVISDDFQDIISRLPIDETVVQV